jgi:hypothetical protein
MVSAIFNDFQLFYFLSRIIPDKRFICITLQVNIYMYYVTGKDLYVITLQVKIYMLLRYR